LLFQWRGQGDGANCVSGAHSDDTSSFAFAPPSNKHLVQIIAKSSAVRWRTRFLTAVTHRVKWRHSNLWSRCDLCVVRHDGLLCEVYWWRFVTLFKI